MEAKTNNAYPAKEKLFCLTRDIAILNFYQIVTKIAISLIELMSTEKTMLRLVSVRGEQFTQCKTLNIQFDIFHQ